MNQPCSQCPQPASLQVSYLAKRSETENEPVELILCSDCMRKLWQRHAHTQFGQTLSLRPL